MDEKNIWQANNVPFLEYCCLKRAADLIGCKEEDIVHLIAVKSVKPIINIREKILCKMYSMVDGSNAEEFLYEVNHPLRIRKAINNRKSILTSRFNAIEKENLTGKIIDRVQRKTKGKVKFSAYIHGWWRVINIQDVMGDNVRARLMFLNANEECTQASQQLKTEDIELNISDFQLLGEDIEKIHMSIGKKMPNHINFLLDDPDDFENNEIEETVINHNAERFAANREKLLKAAIYSLINHKEECTGTKGAITLDSWAKTIISNQKGTNFLPITNKQVIMRLLSEARSWGDDE